MEKLEEQRIERLKLKAENQPEKQFDFHKRHDNEDDINAEPPSKEEKFILHCN